MNNVHQTDEYKHHRANNDKLLKPANGEKTNVINNGVWKNRG